MTNLYKNDPNISSAEMTAYWRSKYPQLSGDNLSIKLASKDGINKAHEFEEKYNYPLVARKVSVRAGFFLRQAVDALLTRKFDSCISFASGFSLLNYYIAAATHSILPDITYVDTDLPNILEERISRVKDVFSELNQRAGKKIESMVFDLEKAAREKKSLREIFPKYKSPIFIIEGVIYFLSQDCVTWLISEISKYSNTVLIIDYWPEDGVKQSQCFERVVQSLQGFIPENIKSFWDDSILKYLNLNFSHIKDFPLQYLEHSYSSFCHEEPQFIDQDRFFPVHLLVAQK